MKKDRMLWIFSLLGLFILALIVVSLLNMVASQIILDPGALLEKAAERSVWKAIWLSAYTAFIATVIALFFGVPLAYLMARERFPLKGLVEAIIDVPIVVPHTVAGIALLTVFGSHGLIGQPLAQMGVKFVDMVPGTVVAMLFVSAPFVINSSREGFQSVDPRLENIARSLGATRWQAFRRICLPLTIRHIFVGGVMCWARAISEFGAVVVIAYYPMIAPTLIYENYISYGLRAARPISVILISFCLMVFITLRLISARWRLYDTD